MQFTTTIQSGVSSYISLTDEMAEQLIAAGKKRVLCKIKGHIDLHRAIQRSKTIGYYIMLGKKSMKEGNLTDDQVIEVELLEDTTPAQAPMPEALEAVLQSDYEAYQAFEKLTPGKQRTIIYLVTGVKSAQKQVERALKIMENIKMGITNPRELLK